MTKKKTAKLEKNYTVLVVDRSGSMGLCQTEAEGGVRGFIDELAKLKTDAPVTLYQFDVQFEKVFGPVDAKQAPRYDLHPRGMTALYDAVGLGIEATRAAIAGLPEKDKPKKVALVIMTDGDENQSREHTFESVSKLIKEVQDGGWEIIFLAGTVEAKKFATASGIRNNTGFDPAKRGSTQTVYAAATHAVTDFYADENMKGVTMPDHVEPDDSDADE